MASAALLDLSFCGQTVNSQLNKCQSNCSARKWPFTGRIWQAALFIACGGFQTWGAAGHRQPDPAFHLLPRPAPQLQPPSLPCLFPAAPENPGSLVFFSVKSCHAILSWHLKISHSKAICVVENTAKATDLGFLGGEYACTFGKSLECC